MIGALKPGDRFVLSEDGRRKLVKTTTHAGIVRRVVREGRACVVVLDGRKGELTLHHSYIEPECAAAESGRAG